MFEQQAVFYYNEYGPYLHVLIQYPRHPSSVRAFHIMQTVYLFVFLQAVRFAAARAADFRVIDQESEELFEFFSSFPVFSSGWKLLLSDAI